MSPRCHSLVASEVPRGLFADPPSPRQCQAIAQGWGGWGYEAHRVLRGDPWVALGGDSPSLCPVRCEHPRCDSSSSCLCLGTFPRAQL